MQPVIRVEIQTEEDCILFQAKEVPDGLARDVANAVALAFENYYQKNFGKYKMTTTSAGGMILDIV